MCNEHFGRHGMRRMRHMNTTHCQCNRNFITKEEKIEMLEEYKKWLEKENKGVQEKIEELKKAS